MKRRDRDGKTENKNTRKTCLRESSACFLHVSTEDEGIYAKNGMESGYEMDFLKIIIKKVDHFIQKFFETNS